MNFGGSNVLRHLRSKRPLAPVVMLHDFAVRSRNRLDQNDELQQVAKTGDSVERVTVSGSECTVHDARKAQFLPDRVRMTSLTGPGVKSGPEFVYPVLLDRLQETNTRTGHSVSCLVNLDLGLWSIGQSESVVTIEVFYFLCSSSGPVINPCNPDAISNICRGRCVCSSFGRDLFCYEKRKWSPLPGFSASIPNGHKTSMNTTRPCAGTVFLVSTHSSTT